MRMFKNLLPVLTICIALDAMPEEPSASDTNEKVLPEKVSPTSENEAADFLSDDENSSKENLEPRLPLNELRIFAEAFSRISSNYVEEIDDRTLLENAIRGMLSQLDPHSAYLDKESFKELQESTTGNYGGLGIEIGMEDGFVKIIAPMDDTPAARAGLEVEI